MKKLFVLWALIFVCGTAGASEFYRVTYRPVPGCLSTILMVNDNVSPSPVLEGCGAEGVECGDIGAPLGTAQYIATLACVVRVENLATHQVVVPPSCNVGDFEIAWNTRLSDETGCNSCSCVGGGVGCLQMGCPGMTLPPQDCALPETRIALRNGQSVTQRSTGQRCTCETGNLICVDARE